MKRRARGWARILSVGSALLALGSACSSKDVDDGTTSSGSGGRSGSGGNAGTATGGSTSSTGGSTSSLGGSTAIGSGGGSAMGNVACGSASCTPATGESGDTFLACCRDAATATCGRKTWDGGACLELHQAGDLDSACPDVQNHYVAQTYPGCCRSDGTCGGMQDAASELGCLVPNELGASGTMSAPCSYTGGAAGGGDGG